MAEAPQPAPVAKPVVDRIAEAEAKLAELRDERKDQERELEKTETRISNARYEYSLAERRQRAGASAADTVKAQNAALAEEAEAEAEKATLLRTIDRIKKDEAKAADRLFEAKKEEIRRRAALLSQRGQEKKARGARLVETGTDEMNKAFEASSATTNPRDPMNPDGADVHLARLAKYLSDAADD